MPPELPPSPRSESWTWYFKDNKRLKSAGPDIQNWFIQEKLAANCKFTTFHYKPQRTGFKNKKVQLNVTLQGEVFMCVPLWN